MGRAHAPAREVVRRLEATLGKRAVGFERVHGGYTPAERWIARFDDQSSAFAKIGTSTDTSKWLREERRTYGLIEGSFLPQILGWDDHETSPLLVLEDLSAGFWPPPWNRARVAAVVAALEELHARTGPFRTFEKARFATWGCWEAVERNSEEFLSLGMASGSWLDRALPELLAAQARVETAGASLIHFDVRSDNICFVGERALLVDWNLACLGNGDLDLGFWLPSLAAEGGPLPESLLPDRSDIAAWVSGFFAARAGQPFIPHAPRVREVQRAQLETALPWVVRALALPPPDGPAAPR